MTSAIGILRRTVAIGLTLTACSPREPANEVDIGSAADAARVSTANYADVAPPRAAAPAPTPSPPPLAEPTPPTVQPPPAPDTSAAAAATVVQTYFTLIEQGKHDRAWHLWDRDGAASGLSPEAFAASFDKYAEYHANVGTPGRIEGAAGQRYVAVPVTIRGTLRDGKPFAMQGPITLHRAGDIDGATLEQRSWRIADTALRPRPPA